MCSLTRHISNPNCHDDAVDDLDIVVDTEIGALVRVAISGDAWNPVARKAGNDLRAWGMFVDVMNGGADATHTLTTSRAVYALRVV